MKKFPTACRICGSSNVKRIVYGYPFDPPADDTVLLGGCVFRDDAPDWHCLTCEAVGSLGLVGEEKVREEIRPMRKR